KLVLTSVTPASSAPVLQTPKATSSTLYFDSLTVNAGNGGFLHCIQMDTSVNAARSEERFSRNAETDLVCRLLLEKKKIYSIYHLTLTIFFFLMLLLPPISTLFPYTTLFRSKLVLTSVTPASSAPVLQTPKATSSTLYFDSLTVNAGNGGFLHCIQMDTSVNAA